MNFLDIAKTRYSVRSYKDKRFEKENIEFNYLDGKIDAKKRLELVEDFNQNKSK